MYGFNIRKLLLNNEYSIEDINKILENNALRYFEMKKNKSE